MRNILGFIMLGVSIYLVRESLENPNNKSIGKLLLSLPVALIGYILLRHLIFKPLEMLGFAVILPSKTANLNDRRFKEMNEHIKNGKLKLALEEIDKILKKKPNWKDAQLRKIQLLGNNFYDIERAKEYAEPLLLNGRFNRNKMDILIVFAAMLRKQGYPNDALNLAFQCRNKAPKGLQKLIDKLEESWQTSARRS
ncbi:MAG: hypothetical protein NE328_20570 [Lentisphaeraceae bacterium]|nr:hypothetical protein [Lentisphaeraceae bacterium]